MWARFCIRPIFRLTYRRCDKEGPDLHYTNKYRQPSLYRHSTQFAIMICDFHEIFARAVTICHKLCKNIVFNTLNICFGYLLESPQWGDSSKYPKHMFYEEIKTKQECSLSILYNSKFILMATSSGTNAVVVTRDHCRTTACAVMFIKVINK